MTVVQSIVYSGSEDSFDAILTLLDQDKSFQEQKVINEYPVLTVLTRIQDPSKELINKLNAYLKAKDASFPYLKKMFLVYSSIIRNYCQKKEGSCKAEAVSPNLSCFVQFELAENPPLMNFRRIGVTCLLNTLALTAQMLPSPT